MSQREDLMAFFWEMFTKDCPPNKKQIEVKNDQELELLYRSGFVDRERHSIEEWKMAFEAHRQKNGSYVLSLSDWSDKSPFVTSGHLPSLFDPMTLREGPWELAEFDRMIEEQVMPALLVDREVVQQSMKPIRDKLSKDSHVYITRPIKAALKNLMNHYPSPMRWLQMKLAPGPSQGEASGFAKGRTEAQSAVDQLSRLLGRN